MENKDVKKLSLCMGSSCFARGNRENLTAVEELITKYHLEDKLELDGLHCCGKCSEGPNIKFDNEEYSHIDAKKLEELILDK